MKNSESVWNSNEKQLNISGFKKFDKAKVEDILNGDIWNRDLVVAESGFVEILKNIENNNPLNLFVGYCPGKPHLGYLVMNRFLKSFREYDKTDITLGINIKESIKTHSMTLEDTLRANEFVEIALLGNDAKKISRIYDLPFLNDLPTQRAHGEIYSRVTERLTFTDFNKILGWDKKTPLSQYENMCMTISGMLYVSSQNKDSISLSFTDINHLPFIRLAKKVSKKLGIKEPSFLITKILPSLTDETKRMSSTGGNSTIYLSNEDAELNKYLKVKSGGRRREEQKIYGGNPDSCLALKIASYVIPSDETKKAISECTSGARDSCGDCKKLMATYINKEINLL